MWFTTCKSKWLNAVIFRWLIFTVGDKRFVRIIKYTSNIVMKKNSLKTIAHTRTHWHPDYRQHKVDPSRQVSSATWLLWSQPIKRNSIDPSCPRGTSRKTGQDGIGFSERSWGRYRIPWLSSRHFGCDVMEALVSEIWLGRYRASVMIDICTVVRRKLILNRVIIVWHFCCILCYSVARISSWNIKQWIRSVRINTNGTGLGVKIGGRRR